MEKCGKGASLNYEFSVGSCLDVGPSFTVQSTADIPPCGYHSDISGKLWVLQLSVVSHHHLIQYLHGLLDIITPIQGIIPMDSPYRNHIFSFTSMLQVSVSYLKNTAIPSSNLIGVFHDDSRKRFQIVFLIFFKI